MKGNKPQKEEYTSPACEMLKMKSEGIICLSPGEYSGFGEEEDM